MKSLVQAFCCGTMCSRVYQPLCLSCQYSRLKNCFTAPVIFSARFRAPTANQKLFHQNLFYLKDVFSPSLERFFLSTKFVTLTHFINFFTAKLLDELVYRLSKCTEIRVGTRTKTKYWISGIKIFKTVYFFQQSDL